MEEAQTLHQKGCLEQLKYPTQHGKWEGKETRVYEKVLKSVRGTDGGGGGSGGGGSGGGGGGREREKERCERKTKVKGILVGTFSTLPCLMK